MKMEGNPLILLMTLLENTYLCAVLFLTVLWEFFDFPDAFHCIVSLTGYF